MLTRGEVAARHARLTKKHAGVRVEPEYLLTLHMQYAKEASVLQHLRSVGSAVDAGMSALAFEDEKFSAFETGE